MATGYEIISSTFTVDTTDSTYFVAPWGRGFVIVTEAAPAGKRWVVRAYDIEPGVPPHEADYLIKADEFSLNADGTEYSAIVPMDSDANGQPVQTTATIRAVAIDA